MAETTYIVGDKAYQRILMNAVGELMMGENAAIDAETRRSITTSLASKGPNPDIVVTVNGIEIPFLKALETSMDAFLKEQDYIAHKKALEMLNASGIGDMIESIQDLRRQFCDRLITLGYDIKPRDEDDY